MLWKEETVTVTVTAVTATATVTQIRKRRGILLLETAHRRKLQALPLLTQLSCHLYHHQ